MTARRPVATFDLSPDPEFVQGVELLRRRGEPATVGNQLRLLRRVLWAGVRGRSMVLYSSRGSLKPDLLACAVMGLWPERLRPATVLVGEMWAVEPGLRHRLERAVVRLADRAVGRYLVLSRAEAELFPTVWPMDPRKLRVRPFYFEPAEHGIDGTVPPRGRSVVAGGDSFRDYGPLVEAARRMPDVPFLLVTKTIQPSPDLPANVEVRSVPYAQYVELLSAAGVVAVPVRTDLQRSAGILTFVMAMHLGKPTVVTRELAVDEYVVDGETGLLVDGTADGWVRALRRLLEDEQEAARLAAAGRAAVQESFSLRRYAGGILAELAEVEQESAQRRRTSRRTAGKVRSRTTTSNHSDHRST